MSAVQPQLFLHAIEQHRALEGLEAETPRCAPA